MGLFGRLISLRSDDAMRRSGIGSVMCVAALLSATWVLPVRAQDEAAEIDSDVAAEVDADVAGEPEVEGENPWIQGPVTAPIGTMATLNLTEKYQYIGPAEAQQLLRNMQNPVSGGELAIVVPNDENSDWFVVFEFSDVGYVKDDERDKLDADAILQSIKDGTEHANEERRRNNWATLQIVGWEYPPKYNAATNNLEWAVRGESEGHAVVNYNTRILGRHGVMEANLVIDPAQLAAVLPEYKEMLAAFAYNPGSTYGEFREGDRIAEYGLTALVAGGAAAVVLKTGLFKKFGKLLVLAVVAAGAGIKKLFGFGRRSEA
jgi:uncharacterized membrane-anchored protein